MNPHFHLRFSMMPCRRRASSVAGSVSRDGFPLLRVILTTSSALQGAGIIIGTKTAAVTETRFFIPSKRSKFVDDFAEPLDQRILVLNCRLVPDRPCLEALA